MDALCRCTPGLAAGGNDHRDLVPTGPPTPEPASNAAEDRGSHRASCLSDVLRSVRREPVRRAGPKGTQGFRAACLQLPRGRAGLAGPGLPDPHTPLLGRRNPLPHPSCRGWNTLPPQREGHSRYASRTLRPDGRGGLASHSRTSGRSDSPGSTIERRMPVLCGYIPTDLLCPAARCGDPRLVRKRATTPELSDFLLFRVHQQ